MPSTLDAKKISNTHRNKRENFPKWKWGVEKKREKCCFSDNGFDLF
jgi:hypothetical protein